MAMEKHFTLRETHTRAIVALGYNPLRREILMGCEDGVIKAWEAETGKLLLTTHEHKGWVTDFLYWGDVKCMLSSANDGVIIAWSSGGGVHDKINLATPVYCMVINPRRGQLVCGMNGSIRLYDLMPEKESGHVIDSVPAFIAKDHTDIVRCVLCVESRIYSGGYDNKLIIYDCSFTGDKSIRPISINHQAHDAGITCLQLVKDNENNSWVVTGSFDKTVKIWSSDGKLVHKLDGFMYTVTDITFVPRNRTVWVSAGMSWAYLFDPKSGDNVSDFIGTFQEQDDEYKYSLQRIKFFPELNQVIGSTSRRQLISWKYNASGCITALKCRHALETITYTHKVPILLFSGDSTGAITKWERMQSNHFMYSKEAFNLADAKKNKKKKPEKERKPIESSSFINHQKLISSSYAYAQPLISTKIEPDPMTGILNAEFVEELDVIVAACEDGNLYVWGFDQAAVKVLQTMKPPEVQKLIRRYAILLDPESSLLPHDDDNSHFTDEESVTNRVAGFICKHVMTHHTSCVTSLVVINRDEYDRIFVVSGGWDQKLVIWNLNDGCYQDCFRDTSSDAAIEDLELACDGIIISMAYNSTTNEIAYASSDKMVYIRKFSPNGAEMKLMNTLQGHEQEITSVKWNAVTDKWITGSEDGTLRIWSGRGMNECEQILSAQGPVSSLCVDCVNGSIVAGVEDIIRVYEPESYRLVQTNVGHTDDVRCILHVPERNQYISVSWDKTIRIWNSFKLPKRKRVQKEEKKSSQVNIQTEMKNFEREFTKTQSQTATPLEKPSVTPVVEAPA